MVGLDYNIVANLAASKITEKNKYEFESIRDWDSNSITVVMEYFCGRGCCNDQIHVTITKEEYDKYKAFVDLGLTPAQCIEAMKIK